MDAWEHNDRKIRSIRELSDGAGIPLGMTECHFSIPGNHRNDVLRTWAAGVSYARILNNHQRHGDVLKIATAADFCGTRCNVNAILLGTHPDRVFLMPVALVMRQFRQHLGTHSLQLGPIPAGIDAVASRTENQVFVNLVNTRFDESLAIDLNIHQGKINSGRGVVIAESPTTEISSLNCLEVMQTRDVSWPSDGRLTLPPASVTSLRLDVSIDAKV